ncbi:MAG TPA: carboxypeptidase regulatory-like domain-containing protein [Gemmatimonadaceae bacterium]|nr:carboxypeptidase regulatory-like domain-containing protein [Gemmatimonadaceae bacterium]
MFSHRPRSTHPTPRAASPPAPRRRPALATLAAALLAATPVAAQQPTAAPGGLQTGSVAGVVLDSLGAPLAGAQVSIRGLFGRGTTGSDGAFRLVSLPLGDRTLLVRRLGFRPESIAVTIEPGATADVRVHLRPVPQQVAPVVVDADRSSFSGRMRDFNERRRRGIGRFFTAEEIDRRKPQLVSDLLRTLPGVRISSSGAQHVVTFRNQSCTPLIWLDGMPASAGYLDPDLFEPHSLAGIEIYTGPATVPAELMWMNGAGRCGVIALWTRVETPVGKQPKRRISAQELANLVASMRLYSAEQVDVPAGPDSTQPVHPLYPDSLLRARVEGRVLVEFVVDTTGEADMETFGEVLSTHPLFTVAARRAVHLARFTPALLDGKRVRQVVQLPIVFVAPEPSGDDH